MAFISTNTSLYLADTRTQNKVVYLPAASTAQGRMITIKDYYGVASLSTLTISTLGLDRIDIQSNTIIVNQDFESIDFIAAGNTGWSILGNYMGALTTRAKSTTVFGIPNLNVWLDGADSTTMTFGNETLYDVMSWKDKSSNAYTFVPVNSNVRSRFSTNCIMINQSTSHFISQVDIPGSLQEDLFCVINENSMRGPLMGLLENADLMWFETDGRYHSQFFADGNQTFSGFNVGNYNHRFFILQGNLYFATDLNPASVFLYSNAAFTLVSTTSLFPGARGTTVMDGRVYFPHANGIATMQPNGLFSTILIPASNYTNICQFNNELYVTSFNSNASGLYPTFKYNPVTGVSSLVAFTGQGSARNFQYNGYLYAINDGGTGNFLQVLNGGNASAPIAYWAPVWNQNYTQTASYIVFSNSIVYGQNGTNRLIEWRQDSGTLYLGLNQFSNTQYNVLGVRSTPINYRGRIVNFLFNPNFNANYTFPISVWSGKGKGSGGGSEFIQVTSQFLFGQLQAAVYDGSLFLGSESGWTTSIFRYGNGATVDVNVSSITGGPRVVMLRKNGTTTSMWVNGVELSNKTVSFTYSNNLAQPWYVGGVTGSILSWLSDPGTDHMNGGLHEILNFTSTLTTSDRQKVEGYLAWKYGVQANLPGSHPYFSSPPTS